MPKAKPVSLWPLSFEEAITAIIRADPNRIVSKPRAVQKRRKPGASKATKS
jgi:hypothetical protein